MRKKDEKGFKKHNICAACVVEHDCTVGILGPARSADFVVRLALSVPHYYFAPFGAHS